MHKLCGERFGECGRRSMEVLLLSAQSVGPRVWSTQRLTTHAKRLTVSQRKLSISHHIPRPRCLASRTIAGTTESMRGRRANGGGHRGRWVGHCSALQYVIDADLQPTAVVVSRLPVSLQGRLKSTTYRLNSRQGGFAALKRRLLSTLRSRRSVGETATSVDQLSVGAGPLSTTTNADYLAKRVDWKGLVINFRGAFAALL